MKTLRATAVRTGYETYRVTYGKVRREVRYGYLLALVKAGYSVRVDDDGWGQTRIPTLQELCR